MIIAPSFSRSSTKLFVCPLGLVISILLPKSGFFSNQFNFSLNATTPPTTIMAGGLTFLAFSVISFNLPTIVSCKGVVPHLMTAIGVSGFLPFSINFLTILVRFFAPIKKIRFSIQVESPFHSIFEPPFDGSSCPVIRAIEELKSLCVSGIPA